MGKKKTTPTGGAAPLPALRIGSRVRCTDDGVEGRIAWANAVSVKIKWDDGEEVTWKRDSLASRPIEILDAEADQQAERPQVLQMPERAETPESTPEQVAEPEPASAEPPAATPAAVAADVAPAKPKRQRKPKAPVEPKVKKPSALDAAARVLAETGVAMTCKELIGAMAAKGYWSSPGGKTPDATLASAILREITVKGEQSRFVKTGPGRFGLRATV